MFNIQKRSFFGYMRSYSKFVFHFFSGQFPAICKLVGSKILPIIANLLNNSVPFVKFPELENQVDFSVNFSNMVRNSRLYFY